MTPDNEVVSDYVRLRDDQELTAKAGEAKARLQQSENARTDSNHDPNAVDPFAPPEMPKSEMPKGQMSNAPSASLRWYTPSPRPQGKHPSRRQILL